MRIVIRTWPEKIEIATRKNYFNPVDHQFIQFRHPVDVMRWVQPHATNNVVMKNVRSMLLAEGITEAETLNNFQLLNKVSTLVYQQKLVLVKTLLLKKIPAVIVLEEKADDLVVQKTVARNSNKQEATAPPPEQKEDIADHEAQAETLVSAAESGAPFCEECEKAKQGKAA